MHGSTVRRAGESDGKKTHRSRRQILLFFVGVVPEFFDEFKSFDKGILNLIGDYAIVYNGG